MIKNIGTNWILTTVQIVVGFLVMPFAIRMLGQDQYGTWILISSLTSYLTMLTLGVPMSTVHFIAKYSTADAQEDLDRTIGSCAGLYALMGLAALVIGAVLLAVFHFGYEVAPALRPRADGAFVIVILTVAAGFFLQLRYGIMGAHHDFVLMNTIQLVSQLVRLGLIFALLTLDASLIWLAVVQLATVAVEFVLASRYVRTRYPRIRIRFRDFDPQMVRRIFSFSLFVLLLQMGSQLAFQTDALVIGAFLPISVIPFFAVAGSIAANQMQFVVGISSVVMPMATTLNTRGDSNELRAVFLKWSKITASLTFAAGTVLIVLGPRLLGWWINPEYEQQSGPVLQILMVGNLVFLPMRGVGLPVLMGLGRPGRPAVAFLILSVANLALSILLVRPLGNIGVALGTAIPNIAYAAYLAVLTCRALDLRLGTYLAYAFGRPLLGAIPVLALLYGLRYGLDVRGVVQLIAAAAAAGLLFGVMSLLFVFRRDPYVDPAQWLRRLNPAKQG